jgi:nanoRNase/pAp phosphatase (c-di-AMP/oligoRNAs hydrolase)
MLLCQKEQGVQQRRIEQQHLLQVYPKAVVVDHHPQEEVVALVQTEEVVHIPEKRKKLE